MSTIFSRIVAGEIPCHKIFEDQNYLAFLDVFPLMEGHTLVIPKIEVDYVFDLNDELLSGAMLLSKKISKAIKAAIPCVKVGVSVIGLEVPHAHIHLIPINRMSDMNFMGEKKKFTSDELSLTASKIRQLL